MISKPNCITRGCIHFIGITPEVAGERPICKAFPAGIPSRIAFGNDLHLTPEDGDGGVVFSGRHVAEALATVDEGSTAPAETDGEMFARQGLEFEQLIARQGREWDALDADQEAAAEDVTTKEKKDAFTEQAEAARTEMAQRHAAELASQEQQHRAEIAAHDPA